MKRLGMWNRLALVIAAFCSLAYPTYWLLQENSKANQLEQVAYDACMANKHYRSYNGKTQFDHCWDFWRVDFKPSTPTLDDWGIMVTFTAILCAFVYAIIAAAVWIAKWIWRGRKAA